MKLVNLFRIILLLLGFLVVPDIARSNDLLSYPDPKAFKGIKVIKVLPISFTNMESVSLKPEVLQTAMQKQLREAAIGVVEEEIVQLGAAAVDSPKEDVGLLAATVRRWETSSFMGPSMNSFAISIRFFQKSRVHPSNHETWAITWLETKSVLVGTKRPKGIADALDELLQSFIRDFKGQAEPK